MEKLTVLGVLSLGPDEASRAVSSLDVASRYALAMGIAHYAAAGLVPEGGWEATKAVFDSVDEPGIVLSAWWAFEALHKGPAFARGALSFQRALSEAMVTGVFGVPVGPTGMGWVPTLTRGRGNSWGPEGFDHVAARAYYAALVEDARAAGTLRVEWDASWLPAL